MSTTNMSLGLGSAPRNSKTAAVATAKQINEQHRLARASAETAIEHAVLCGQMLLDKKFEVGHGKFEAWVEKNCDFSVRQARRYIQASKGEGSAAFDSLRQALGYDRPSKKTEQKQSETHSKSDTCVRFEATRIDTPDPDSVVLDVPKPGPLAPTSTRSESRTDPIENEPERPEWDAQEDAALEAASLELMASAERALGSDAITEIKRLTAELSAVKLSRDGYMDGKAEITRLLQAEQRKAERLLKRVAELQKENEQLRQRIESMEGNA